MFGVFDMQGRSGRDFLQFVHQLLQRCTRESHHTDFSAAGAVERNPTQQRCTSRSGSLKGPFPQTWHVKPSPATSFGGLGVDRTQKGAGHLSAPLRFGRSLERSTVAFDSYRTPQLPRALCAPAISKTRDCSSQAHPPAGNSPSQTSSPRTVPCPSVRPSLLSHAFLPGTAKTQQPLPLCQQLPPQPCSRGSQRCWAAPARGAGARDICSRVGRKAAVAAGAAPPSQDRRRCERATSSPVTEESSWGLGTPPNWHVHRSRGPGTGSPAIPLQILLPLPAKPLLGPTSRHLPPSFTSPAVICSPATLV